MAPELPISVSLAISSRGVLITEANVTWRHGEAIRRWLFDIDVESGLLLTGSHIIELVAQPRDGAPIAAQAVAFPFMDGGLYEAVTRHGIIVMDQPPLDFTPTRLQRDRPTLVAGWALGPVTRRGNSVRICVDGRLVAVAPLDESRDLRPLYPDRQDAAVAGFQGLLAPTVLPAGRHVISTELVLEDGAPGPICGTSVVRPGAGIEGDAFSFRDFQPKRDLSGRTRPPVAVLVRTHRNDAKCTELFEQIQRGEGDYDSYCVADETDGPIDLPFDPARIVRTSVATMRLLGLRQESRLLMWLCGDVCFYTALTALPPYDYYLMIEYDMHLVRGDASFIGELCRRLAADRAIDMVGIIDGLAGPQWAYHAAAARVFPHVHGMYYPLLALSRRAISYLYSQRMAESHRQPEPADVVHCEPFTASALHQGGFICRSFDELAPGTLDRALLSNDIRNARLMGHVGQVPPGVELVHPVFTLAEYQERLTRALLSGWISVAEARELVRQRAVAQADQIEIAADPDSVA